MLKRLFTTIALATSLLASACWFGDNYTGDLEDNYIAYLSGDAVHYEPTGPNSYKITNGQTVAMPFTVFIKVSPHKTSGSGSTPILQGSSSDSNTENKITKAVLQYKLIKNGNGDSSSNSQATGWVTVKTIENPDWDMDFSEPVALFGRDTINVPGLTEDTVMLIRLYLTDGTYADLLAQQTANFKALGLGEPKGSDRITFVIGWYSGDQFDKVRGQAAYEANKELKTLNMGTLCAKLGLDFETVVLPCYEGETAGRNLLFNLFGNNGNWERSAKYFWPLLTAGELRIDWGKQKYAQIIAYEIGKEDFDAAELKAKLTRGILVYKGKARLWKPSKEGEANPFIEFVGMLQDTAKDL